MAAQIQELIDKQDTSEIVRDQIARILVEELADQQAKASQAGRDPREWTLNVYLERSNPWSDFLDPATTDQLDNPPLVNISLDTTTMDGKASNQVERQKYTATYHLDCYGIGLSTDVFEGGHVVGDSKAAIEAQRAVRLVRNILMSSYYTYLDLPRGTVWTRQTEGVTIFQPQLDNREVQQVVAARISFTVEFNEFSPQVEGEPLQIVNTTVRRKENGLVYFVVEKDFGP